MTRHFIKHIVRERTLVSLDLPVRDAPRSSVDAHLQHVAFQLRSLAPIFDVPAVEANSKTGCAVLVSECQ